MHLSQHRFPRLPTSSTPSTLSMAVLALGLSAALAGCSGDDGDPAAESGPSASESAGAEETSQGPGAQEFACQVKVDVTGAVEASWRGADVGTARTLGSESTGGGPAATYITSRDGNQLYVYSTGENFEGPAVTFTTGDQTFSSTPADAASIEAAEDASSAVVGLSVFDAAGDEAVLDASFTCGDDPSASAGDGQGGKNDKGGKGGRNGDGKGRGGRG